MNRHKCLQWVIVITLVTAVYAFLRYNIFKGVLFIHIPLYIVNKIAACSGLALLSLSALVKLVGTGGLSPSERARRATLAGRFGTTGLFFSLVHMVISLAILNLHYFPNFFINGTAQAGKMNLTGELSLLFGIVGLLVIVIMALHFSPITASHPEGPWLTPSTIYRLGIIIYFLAALHVGVMGYSGWFKPATWPGGMPPMTLLAFIIAVVPLIMLLFAGKIKRS